MSYECVQIGSLDDVQHVLKRLLYVSKEDGFVEELNPGEFLVSKQTQKLHIFPPYGSSYISLNVDDRYDWEKHPRGSERVLYILP